MFAKNNTKNKNIRNLSHQPQNITLKNSPSFGMMMPERSFSSASYRYGFNGKETDSEWDIQDYGMRMYNPKLGKFISVDPLKGKYPELTPYQFASNTPIIAIDLDGLEAYFGWDGTFIKWGPIKSNDAPVIIMYDDYDTEEVIFKYSVPKALGLNYGQFMNRVHWAFGEGVGMASDYYACAINNLSKRDGEDEMYTNMNCGETGTASVQKDRYFRNCTKGNINYKNFRDNYRGSLVTTTVKDKTTTNYQDDFDKINAINGSDYNSRMARSIADATISVIMGDTPDLTGGATTWAGGASSENYVKNHATDDVPITKVTQTTEGGFHSVNYFYKEGALRESPNKNIKTVAL